MKRRIIKQGHNTLTITLPSNWAKKFNLKAGNEIDLLEKENGLFLTVDKINSEEKRIEIDITKMDIPTIWKNFMAAYREGYDEVYVKFDPKSQLESPYKFMTQHRLDLRYRTHSEKKSISRVLQGFVDRFIGFEIIEHGKNFILIKDMGEPTSKEFDNSLRRVFLLLKQMSEETAEAIETKNPLQLTMLHDIDINLDKFHDYCIRVLNKIGNKEQRKISLLFSTLYLIEMTGDEFKNIAFHLVHDFQKSRLKNIKGLCDFVREQINNYYDLFYKFDEEKVRKISELDQRTYIEFPNWYSKATESEKEIFHHLRMIGRYINSLMELRIEMEY